MTKIKYPTIGKEIKRKSKSATKSTIKLKVKKTTSSKTKLIPKAKLKTGIAIPYNPYEPEPYQRWTLAGLYDLPEELLVADEFWNFLGSRGACEELLTVFEAVGIELRPEIDTRFAKFK